MKKISLKDGSTVFLPEEYMPNLIPIIRNQLGDDAAELVEGWANEEVPSATAFAEMAKELRDLKKYAESLRETLDRERETHAAEIGELEDELTRLAGANERILSANEWMSNERKAVELNTVTRDNVPEIVDMIVDAYGKPASTLLQRCGLGHNTISYWRHRRYSPHLYSFLALANTAGFRLIVVRE